MASNTDKFKKGARRFTTTIGAGGVPDAVVTTIPLASVTGLPTDTAIEITIDRVDASGNLTLSLEEIVTGVVSGSNLITCIRGVEGTAQAHSVGSVVEIRLTADQWDDVCDGILVEHEQDGTHDDSVVVTLTGTQTLTNKTLDTPIINGFDGWQPYSGTMPTSPSTTDGVDTLTLTDADDFLSKGAKVKITSGAGTHMYYVSDATSTNFKVNGETSVTGTITAMWYSYADCPFGFKPKSYYAANLFRDSIDYAVPTSTMTYPDINDVSFDDSGASAGGGYTVPITGKYAIDLGFRGDSATWLLRVALDDSTKERLGWIRSADCAGLSGSVTKHLKKDVVVNMGVYQESGSSKNFKSGRHDSFVSVEFLGV